MNRSSLARDLGAILLVACTVLIPEQAAADAPPLPAGLTPADSGEPALPAGLGGDAAPVPGQATVVDDAATKPRLMRFWDTRVGIRLQDDSLVDDDFTLAETRLRIEYQQQWDLAELVLKGDLLFDALADDRGIDIERREGWAQLREFKLGLQPHPRLDMMLGRQVLTWGTGDLVFINDLFPKDFNSFFIGRAEEYLKSPVDTLRISAYFDPFNIDLVYSPRFDSNLYLDPQRLSFFGSPGDRQLPVDLPDDWFSDDEVYLRAYRRAGSWELAVYGYDGFWKGPEGFDLGRQVYLFPRLAVIGASVRGPMVGGIVNAEYGYYDSKDAGLAGSKYAPPSEQRLLLGYQRELVRELELGLQYYLRHIEDYGDYQNSRPPGSPDREQDRHVVTARLTRLLMNQDLRLSLFAFLSPTDEDGYLRPQLTYRFDDHSSVEAGANVFFGQDDDTFFGQLDDNTNIYTAFRYEF